MTGLFAVDVNPGDYAGNYDVGEGSVQGPSTVELAPGNYSLQLGSVAELICRGSGDEFAHRHAHAA